MEHPQERNPPSPELSEDLVVCPAGLLYNDVLQGFVRVYGMVGEEFAEVWNDEVPMNQLSLRDYE